MKECLEQQLVYGIWQMLLVLAITTNMIAIIATISNTNIATPRRSRYFDCFQLLYDVRNKFLQIKNCRDKVFLPLAERVLWGFSSLWEGCAFSSETLIPA